MNVSGQYVDFPIFNALIPKEGPKVVPFNFDFTVNASYDIDLQNQQTRGFITMVQTIWIDNSLNDQPLTIVFSVVGQKVKAPPRWQGYFPVMVINPPRFTVSSVGSTGSAQIGLMNVPFPAAAWASEQATGTFDADGNMLVSDLLLDGAISGGQVQTAPFVMSQNDERIPLLNASQFLSGNKNTAGNTVILAAGGAAANFFVSSIDLALTGDASLAVAGNLDISLTQSGVAFFTKSVTLPAAAGTGTIIPVAQISGLNFLGSALNATLGITLSVALATGKLNYNIGAGYSAYARP